MTLAKPLTLRAARKRIRELVSEEKSNYRLIARQGDLLTGVVNALKGVPPPLTIWSHHDAPELASKAAAALREIREMISCDCDSRGPKGICIHCIATNWGGL